MSRFFQATSDEEEEVTQQVAEPIPEEKPAPKKDTKEKPAQKSRFQVDSDSASEPEEEKPKAAPAPKKAAPKEPKSRFQVDSDSEPEPAEETNDKIGEISESKPEPTKSEEPQKLSKRAQKKLKDDAKGPKPVDEKAEEKPAEDKKKGKKGKGPTAAMTLAKNKLRDAKEAKEAEEARLAEEARVDEIERIAKEKQDEIDRVDREKKAAENKIKREARKKQQELDDKEASRLRAEQLLQQANAVGPGPAHHPRKRKGGKKQEEPKAQEIIAEKTESEVVAVVKTEDAPAKVEPEVVLGEGNWMDLVDEEKDNVDPLADKLKNTQQAVEDDKKPKEKKLSGKEKRDAKKRAMAPVKEEPTVTEEVITEDTKVPEVVADEKYWMDPMDAFHVESKFRCPIIAILGHVDTGKTKLLDKIRNTNVQNGEAGGITQQIGASFFPQYKLREEVHKVDHLGTTVEVPGLLIIDTPGHESFSNLRSRGSSLCDFAILVVDIMHGLENQTLESIQLLQARNTPFVIALNKIDRLKDWVEKPNSSSYKSLQSQGGFTKGVFDEKWKPIFTQLAMQDINAEMYWKNDNEEEYVSIVPTSAITGEGICDI